MRLSLLIALLLPACRKHDLTDPRGDDGIDAQVSEWLADMSLDEKVAQMHGLAGSNTDGLWRTAPNDRLGIPQFAMSDGPRGVTAGISTTFPVGMARGATWDPELEQAVGAAIGLELAAKGGNVILAPVVEVLRHPAWGRAQETYGEDTHLLSAMGAAFVTGAQQHVIATPKHFAVNSIEDTRFTVDVTVDEAVLRELYLPPHQAALDAGAGAIMSAYNSVNGDFCAENVHLLRDILKGEWAFDGFVMSDWLWGTHDTLGMAAAGLDVEMPADQFYGAPLVEAVQSGQVDVATIDDGVTRILRTKLAFGLDDPPAVDAAVVASPEHVALALQVAERSIVLLKNDLALPLDGAQTISVIGPLADVANLGDSGSSKATPPYAVTPLVGIDEAAGRHGASVVLTTDPAQTAFTDAAIVVVGLTGDDEGEQIPLFPGGDRDTLALHADDIALIGEVASWNPRTIVVLEGGSAITVEGWIDQVQGLVMAWYPGMEGGTALGALLFGEVDFEGRLPLTIPASEADLPPFDHSSDAVTYDAWHGYRKLDHDGVAARFPFGFGLSYTEFALTDLSATVGPETIDVTVTARNAGARAGATVVQVYVGGPAGPDVAVRDLRGFAKVRLEPGASTDVTIPVRRADLARWSGDWIPASGTWTIEVGTSAADLPLVTTVDL